MKKSEIHKISKIIDNVYISGTNPLQGFNCPLDQLNIKCILSCINSHDMSDIHNKIIEENPDITILYVPFDLINNYYYIAVLTQEHAGSFES